jgi:hypothetical protein
LEFCCYPLLDDYSPQTLLFLAQVMRYDPRAAKTFIAACFEEHFSR